MELVQLYNQWVTPEEALLRMRRDAMAGLRRWRRGQVPAWMEKALDEELACLKSRYDDLLQRFLILWDGGEYARVTDNLLGPGAGPLTECVLAYGLGLTQVDPEALASFRSALPLMEAAPRLVLQVGSDTAEELQTYLSEVYGPRWNGIELRAEPALARLQELLSGQEAHEVRILPGCGEESVWQALRDIPRDDEEVWRRLAGEEGTPARFRAGLLTGPERAKVLLLYQDTYFRVHAPQAYQKAWTHYPDGDTTGGQR